MSVSFEKLWPESSFLNFPSCLPRTRAKSAATLGFSAMIRVLDMMGNLLAPGALRWCILVADRWVFCQVKSASLRGKSHVFQGLHNGLKRVYHDERSPQAYAKQKCNISFYSSARNVGFFGPAEWAVASKKGIRRAGGRKLGINV